MGRTLLTVRRAETKKVNIGRIVIFCEGITEKYYFEYFTEIIKKNKYNDVEIILQTANGNAQTVLNFANSFIAKEENNRKYNNYGKYLAFDCDAPSDIQAVISACNKYELLISNHLFETWLLMHFEEVNERISKAVIFRQLSSHLTSRYLKGSKGIIREIIQNGDIEKAIDNGKTLAQQYENEGKSVLINMTEMNPYTTVHQLIEQFMVEISE